MKRCPRCGETKPTEAFRALTGRRSMQSWCRPCKSAYSQDWYKRNRETHRKAVTELKHRRAEINRRLLWEAKKVPCVDCGVRYPPHVMDLDHGGSEKNGLVANVVRIWPSERLLAEIAKCDVVCANCHRERTLAPRGRHVDA